jgi:hypothetical protein
MSAGVRVVDALVIVDMIVVLDEGADLPFEIVKKEWWAEYRKRFDVITA